MNDLPRFVTITVALVILLMIVVNILADIFVAGYSGYPTLMALVGLLGLVLGIDRKFRNGGDD